MADPIVLQAEPVPEETAQKIQAAMGAANEANLTAMLAMRAELEAQTMRGEDGRLHRHGHTQRNGHEEPQRAHPVMDNLARGSLKLH